MAYADIMGSVGLDASGVKRGVDQANKAVGGMAQQGTVVSGKLTKDFGKVGGSIGNISQMANGLKGMLAGMFTIGAITAYINKMGQLSTEIQNASNVTGVSTNALQSIADSAEEAGGSLSSVISSFTKLQKSQSEAISGSESLTKNFQDLGISSEQLRTSSPEQLFEMISKKMVEANFSGAELSSGMAVLGNNITELNGAMSEIASGGMQEFINAKKDMTLTPEELGVWTELKTTLGDFGDWGAKKVSQAAIGLQDFAAVATGLMAGLGLDGAVDNAVGWRKGQEQGREEQEKAKAAKAQEARDAAVAKAKATEDKKAADKKAAEEAKASQQFDQLLQRGVELEKARAMARMTDAEKILAIEKEINDEKAKENKGWDEGTVQGRVKAQTAANKQQELQSEKDAIKERMDAEAKASEKKKKDFEDNKRKEVNGINSDARSVIGDARQKLQETMGGSRLGSPANDLARVGGFIGGRNDIKIEKEMRAAQQRQEQIQIQRDTLATIKELAARRRDAMGAVFTE